MNKILSLKPGHDGHIAYIQDSNLVFSIEAEKNSWPRYADLSPYHFINCMQYINEIPDVLALSGWVRGFHSISAPIEGGYFGSGTDTFKVRTQNFMGKKIDFFSSSHERSHLLCTYGLSPFPQGEPCYILVWEGNIGAFYLVDEQVRFTKIADVLEDPGNKYAFLYSLADPTFPLGKGKFRFENAGKLMALVAYGKEALPSNEQQRLIDFILSQRSILLSLDKKQLSDSPYFNIGVETQTFKDLAKQLSNAVFKKFYDYAKEHLDKKYPLLISGGCGLNCDWNSMWKNSGLFSDVFVPPCTNDSGSAIGTAIDAQLFYNGNAKINWSVYAGEYFVKEDCEITDFEIKALNFEEVASFLSEGNIIAWVQGKYEIGPRALGNRSILAMPFTKEIHARLNRIKKRESFRPIAPVCMEEEVDRLFENDGPSPHMLYFQKLKTNRLPAITHVDNSARLQSVNASNNPALYSLLSSFKKLTDYGVLCNTSLNFNGTGFINSMSDLLKYVRDNEEINGFVVENMFYKKKRG